MSHGHYFVMSDVTLSDTDSVGYSAIRHSLIVMYGYSMRFTSRGISSIFMERLMKYSLLNVKKKASASYLHLRQPSVLEQ
jgi:hypothetical protein